MELGFRRRYRHLKRFREIANVMVRHGFGYAVHELGLGDLVSLPRRLVTGREEPAHTRGARLRRALEELGPTFIKLGQVLATRSDLLAPDLVEELSRLLDQAPPFPLSQVLAELEGELGRPAREVFSRFDAEPLATASIGQVHRAALPSGQEVVVKVQRPGVTGVIATDLEILYDVARWAERHTAWGRVYGLTGLVEEFERTMQEETDYTAEARHIDAFRRNFRGDPHVCVPEVYWEYTTRRVLTMEYLEGVRVTDRGGLAAAEADPKVLARRLAHAVLKQILIDGFFHADPHPGNLLVLKGGRLAFLDFGMVGRLGEQTRLQIARLVLGLVNRNTSEVVRAVLNLNVVPRQADLAALRQDVDRLRAKYYEVPLQDLRLTDSLGDLMKLAHKYRVRVPKEFTMMVKALVTTEGVVARLDPRLSLARIAGPFGRRLLAERYRPRQLRRALGRNFAEYALTLLEMPRRLHEVLELLARGEL
ncbi:MAG: AarF/ABC1/UbiB kinase family protein, partial [Firmicutes bacterium]|nr:AarF/ABC1/UbiB kinase family protein [Bacillota bacterium]